MKPPKETVKPKITKDEFNNKMRSVALRTDMLSDDIKTKMAGKNTNIS